MTQNDPTDSALAAIASILDHKDVVETKAPVSDVTLATETPHAPEAFHFSETIAVVSETITVTAEPDTRVEEHDAPATAPETVGVDGYTRVGPGPLDAIRFRWTARRGEHGEYFVDETIGASRPISSGPMHRDDVVAFIDGRERAARARFDELKSSMTLGRTPGRRGTYEDIDQS